MMMMKMTDSVKDTWKKMTPGLHYFHFAETNLLKSINELNLILKL
jgi:hypothetical protein